MASKITEMGPRCHRSMSETAFITLQGHIGLSSAQGPSKKLLRK